MKKLALLVLVCTLLLLSGCGCEHEWVGGTCEEPYICAKCSEIGPVSSGHDWIVADCENPETCRHCGAIQGAPLGHTYSEWEFMIADDTLSEMIRVCSVCQKQEQIQADWEVFSAQRLPGYWGFTVSSDLFAYAINRSSDLLETIQMRESLHIHYNPEYSIYTIFYPDGTGIYYDMSAHRYFSWKFAEYDASRNRGRIHIAYDDGTEATVEMDTKYLYIRDGDKDRYSMSCEPMAEWIGLWQFQIDEQQYTLELLPDRTLTGQFPEGTATGTWTPLCYGMDHFGDGCVAWMSAVMEYTANGKTYTQILRYYAEVDSSNWRRAIVDAFLADPEISFLVADYAEPVTLRKVG